MRELSIKANVFLTREEYLALEDKALEKSEYHNGEMLCMAGGSLNHARICLNVYREFGNVLKNKPCEVFTSDVKLDIESKNLYYYPDAMVVCGEIEFVGKRNDIVRNPVLIIEVLSPSTALYDFNAKLWAYQTLPSLKEYVIIHQNEPRIVSYFRNDGNEWLTTFCENTESILKLRSLNIEIPLREIFHKVVFNT